ncbi:MAG: hypothetical protein GY950_05580 [bacterium]|nr:hypothetical protein [bacterium]
MKRIFGIIPVWIPEKISAPFNLDTVIGFFKNIGERSTDIWHSAGFYMVVNVLLVIIVCLVFSMWDIKGWSVGKKNWKDEVSTWFIKGHFWLLVSANFFITLIFYAFIGETGGIRYDNPMSAFILSLVLAAVLRVTFFHPLVGKHYDRFTLWVYDNMGTYSNSDINLIAYYNSKDDIRKRLEDISHGIPDREKRIRMRVRMEEILRNQTETELSIRKSLARLLLQYHGCIESVTHSDYLEEVGYIYRLAHHWVRDKDKEKQINEKLKELSEKPASPKPELVDKREYRRLNRLGKMKRSSVYIMREKITLLFLLKEYKFLQNLQEEDFFKKSWDVPNESLKGGKGG